MALRIWKQSPVEYWRADSPVKACFDVLRELQLLNQHVKATAISRAKGSGILLLPEEMVLPTSEVEIEGMDVDPFTLVLTEVLAAALKNPDSAAALVPIILRAPAEFIGLIRLLDLSTEFDAMVPELRNNAIRRLALGMDSPPEILLGSSESSSWSMWQVSEAEIRLHIRPMGNLIASSLTEGWLKPALAMIPMAEQTREGLDRIGIYADYSALNVRPDVGQDAAALHAAHLISDDAYVHILGLGEKEKPTSRDVEYQLLLEIIRTNPQLAPWAIDSLNERFGFNFPKPPDPNAAPAENGTPPNLPPTGTAPMIPGERSVAKQTKAVKAEPIDGDTNNNEGV